MFISGFGFSNYRSFGYEEQRIAPLGSVNIFIGQNNSGKSNVLKFIHQFLSPNFESCFDPKEVEYGTLDWFNLQANKERKFSIGFEKNSIALQSIRQKCAGNYASVQAIEKLLGILGNENLAWISFRGDDSHDTLSLVPELIEHLKERESFDWSSLYFALKGQRANTFEIAVREILLAILRAFRPLPGVVVLPANRVINSNGEFESSNFNGTGLIDELAKLQNPEHDKQFYKEKFNKINKFLQNVTGRNDAHLEIPHSRKSISVDMAGKVLPLENLGSGIHEVILIAVLVTVTENKMICLEEPELHLHPVLQKKLIQFLCHETTNQYFIATHSAHFMDCPGVQTFSVRLEKNSSVVEHVNTDLLKRGVTDDLGYRPSDLLHANCLIWVEGPSDRLYVNHWIQSVALELVEGMHYSVMFYGGKLLSHTSASTSEELDHLIKLRRLNQKMCVIMDSDKKDKNSSLNATKQRLVDELSQGGGFAWVTKGREIENYIPRKLLEASINASPAFKQVASHDDVYGHMLDYLTDQGDKRTADKLKAAHAVKSSKADLSLLDLKERVQELVDFIKASN